MTRSQAAFTAWRPRRALGLASLLTAAIAACTDGEQLADLDDLDDAEVAPREAVIIDGNAFIDAAGLSLQRLEKPSAFGDTRVFVQLDKADIKKLANPAALAAGDKDAPMLLRDDGQGGDVKGGDGVFTGLIFADLDAMKLRAELDQQEKDAKVSQFTGRSVSATVAPEALDLNTFLSGGVIKLPPVIRRAFSLPRARKSLMITDVSVVRDLTRTYDACTDTGSPMGPWSFGHLMTEMANTAATGIVPSDLVEDWLSHWLVDQLPGSSVVTVQERLKMQQVIDDWRAASGGGQLDLAKAPFRLLAIVNRVDLARRGRGGGGYGGGIGGDFHDAGEGRFVFGLVLPSGYSTAGYNTVGVTDPGTGCKLTPFTVIFEYKIDRAGCINARDWARQWQALDAMPFGAGYNAALQAITDQFTAAGASPGRGNGSALGQLRTNDFLLANPWQMREDQIPASGGFLEPHQVADTVELFRNFSVFLGNWIASNGMALPPQSFPWAGSSDVQPGTFWDGAHSALNTLAIVSGAGNDHNDFRHNFSLGACSGCHMRETDALFTHIDNRTPLGRTQEAILSEFLLGEKVSPASNNTVTGGLHRVNDPSIIPRGGTIATTNPQHVRGFRDLERRQQTLADFASQSCISIVPHDPVLVADVLVGKKALPADLFEGVKPPEKIELAPKLSLERFADAPVVQTH